MSVYEDERNPMRTPDLTPMYEAVRDFVKGHQGDKGFICTDNDECDTIYAILYDNSYEVYEKQVKAIRVMDNEIQIVTDYRCFDYTEESIAELDDDVWSYDIRYDDFTHYIPTIFNIAESITEYA